jgi:small subunit ribosomal protein S17
MKKSIGLDVKPPEKACEDPKCAWHGKVSLRGRVFSGTVKSAKARHSAVVRWDYHSPVRKYERYERKHTKITVHNPPCIHAREGDTVVIAECRPLSKTKSFIIVSKEARKVKAAKGGKK